MSVPDAVRDKLRVRLWTEADDLFWISLPAPEKARRYDIWSRSKSVGGELAMFLDPRAVRVYIKDTLMKDYTRQRLADPSPKLRALSIPLDRPVANSYEKPHGRRFADGGVVCWSKGQDWKTTVIATRERAEMHSGGWAEGIILIGPARRYSDNPSGRNLVENVARDLGIEKFGWIGV